MAIQLEAYQWILVLITVISTVVGTVKILWGRIELNLNTNFKTVQNQLEDVSKQAAKSQQDVRELERKFYQFQIDLPHSYVAREDYIRGQTVIEAKLDALASKLETVQIKQGMAQK
ncbi:hypothetical protein AY606_00755 [Acinetobacter sp. SFB]|uniref:hypothetical protein n=1 Tax=Acinetobacter sp. SFB TaxID=1805634 RepID=UPI0007D78D71|nr:hypothetical protein [Acinetobacter sp. SFB]OAL81315.1 hypothetical protein AY606_00755 [Acinetobacter sp. SFB]